MNLARFAYSPVSFDRKSGMPAEVEIPAPARMTTFFTRGWQMIRLIGRGGTTFGMRCPPFLSLINLAASARDVTVGPVLEVLPSS